MNNLIKAQWLKWKAVSIIKFAVELDPVIDINRNHKWQEYLYIPI